MFNVARFLSCMVSIMGILIFAAADSIQDDWLMTIQIVISLIIFMTGIGYYCAFKYYELYLRERERRERRNARQRILSASQKS